MSGTFRALRLNKTDDGQSHEIVELTENDLMEGDVTVAVSHSTLNYKDGLALTGASPVVRVWPIVPGIDFAGVVETSNHAGFQPGDNVILNGRGWRRRLGGFGALVEAWLSGCGLDGSPRRDRLSHGAGRLAGD